MRTDDHLCRNIRPVHSPPHKKKAVGLSAASWVAPRLLLNMIALEDQPESRSNVRLCGGTRSPESPPPRTNINDRCRLARSKMAAEGKQLEMINGSSREEDIPHLKVRLKEKKKTHGEDCRDVTTCFLLRRCQLRRAQPPHISAGRDAIS